MASPVSAGKAVARLQEVVANVEAIAEREEDIAMRIRRKVVSGEVNPDFVHRAQARADTLMRLAADLREAVGLDSGRRW